MRLYNASIFLQFVIFLGGVFSLHSTSFCIDGFALTDDGVTVLTGPLRTETCFLMKRDRSMWVYKWSDSSEEWLAILTTGNNIRDIGLSPSGKYCIIIDNRLAKESDGYIHYKLNLYDSGNKLIESFPDIYKYSFSKNEMYLALITGDYRDENESPVDTLVIDLQTRVQRSLGCKARELKWAQHDNKLYLSIYDNENVVCYDPIAGTMTDTAYRGIYFSPSGAYYLCHDADGTQVYKSADNTCIFDNKENGMYPMIYAADWLGDDTAIFFLGRKSKDFFGRPIPDYGVASLNLVTDYLCHFSVDHCIGVDKVSKRMVCLEDEKIRYYAMQPILSGESDSDICRQFIVP